MNDSTTITVKWPEDEVKALKAFCIKYNIEGFDHGMMPPSVALSFLKTKLGIADSPLTERVPYGDKKILHG